MNKKRIKPGNLVLCVSGRCFQKYLRCTFSLFLILVFSTYGYSQDIHHFVYEGNLDKVETLLEKNPLLVNKEDSRGRTPIFTAIMRRNHKIVKFLIDKGALVRVGDNNLRAPIHFAGFMNDIDMIKLLIEKGAPIDTRAIGAATPLIHSSLFNRIEMSRFLIEHGAEINIQCNALTTPLYFAALNNNLTYVRYLLDAGADIDTPDFLSRTPLYVAVRDGYLETVKILINNGADFRIKDFYLNRSLLHLAAIQGHKEIAELLIQKGMEVIQTDDGGCMPLDYANRYGHESTADFLKRKGGKANVFGNLISEENLPYQNIQKGGAVIIKLQNGSWGIRTQKHFLIFAYSEIGSPPPDKSIVNGYITGNEMRDVSWIYFDLSFHPPKANFSLQGWTPIYSMQDRVDNLSFVLNDAFKRSYSGLNLNNSYFPKPEQPVDVEGLKVTVIRSYQHKKGYLIECGGLTIFWLSGLSDDYNSSKKDTRAIEFVKEGFSGIDLLILGTPDGIGPEKGNGIREAYLESMGLNPKAVFFMGKEPLERRIRYQIRRRVQDPENIYCSGNPGDRFCYNQRKIKSPEQDDSPVLKGPYLGQKPPGMTLEIFAPGIVTTEKSESAITVSPDLNEIYFIRKSPKAADNSIWYSRVENGKLTNPQIVPFAYDCIEGYPCFTPDGKRLYYISGRHIPGHEKKTYWGNIWFVDRNKDGWSDPKLLETPINDLNPHFLSMDNKGTLYFGSGLKSVYYAKLSDKKYSEAVKLPDEINCFESVSHPAIAPDGSYLIVDVYWKENDNVKGSLFISFKKPDGSWTKIENMREALKITDSYIWCSATITPDGKYIFVERFVQEDRKSDLFWVSTEIIKELKPGELK